MAMSEYQFLGAEIEKSRAELRLAHKKNYRRLVGIAFGAAGLAAGLAGLPLSVSIALWAMGAAAWWWLKRL
jgi:hypothetical protein